MRAAVFLGSGVVEIQDVPAPSVSGPTDVVVKVAANALCGTDLHALEVPPSVIFTEGIILGHEIAGTVEAAGEGSGVRPGDRVAILPNVTCGHCHYCRIGVPNMCDTQEGFGSLRLHGGAAEYVYAPSDVVYRIPDELDLELASIAEPLACVLNGARRAGWGPGTAVVILGGGPIGMMYALSALAWGVRDITVVEPTDGRQRFLERLGFAVVHPDDADAMGRMERAGADVVIDTVGTLIATAVRIARRRGTIVLFGLNDNVHPAFPQADLIRKELRIEGVFLASNTFPLALDLLTRPELGFDRLITHRFRLDEFDAAVDSLRRGDAVKAVVLPNS